MLRLPDGSRISRVSWLGWFTQNVRAGFGNITGKAAEGCASLDMPVVWSFTCVFCLLLFRLVCLARLRALRKQCYKWCILSFKGGAICHPTTSTPNITCSGESGFKLGNAEMSREGNPSVFCFLEWGALRNIFDLLPLIKGYLCLRKLHFVRKSEQSAEVVGAYNFLFPVP